MARASRTSIQSSAFTIVELLIVIVVVAVLAAVSVVAYTGIQGRAKDAQRLQDMKTIMKALEVYKITNGNYPAAVSTAGFAGWEASSASGGFIPALVSASSGVTSVPVDPINSIAVSAGIGSNSQNFLYFYHRYSPGSSNCDPNRGHFYVLGVTRFDTIARGQSHPQTEGLVCPLRTWGGSEGAYVVARFVN